MIQNIKIKKNNISKPSLQNNSRRVIAILGQTATGKSDLAIKLAKKYNGEIVNADSRAFYKHMTIGTAKPKKDKKIPEKYSWIKKFKNNGPYVSKDVVHWIIDFETMDNPMNAGMYKNMADSVINQIFSRGKIPIVVGGSGLYASIILDGFSIPKVEPDEALRKKLEKMSVKNLALKFKKLDPKSSEKIDLKNKRRLIRAYEITFKTGKSFIEQTQKIKPNYKVLKIGIENNKQNILENITKRTGEMIKDGLIEEVKKIRKYGLDKTQVFNSTIGYPQILQYIKGETSLDEATEEIELRIRQFAKRQKTWFKKEKDIKWIKTQKEAEKLVNKFLKS